jgi:uncharacterized surface protein with fasciclin (FAS1) repeats
LAGGFPACTEKWDDHYTSQEIEKGENLYATLQSYPELSRFVRMVEIAGFKEAFSGLEAFTVWAPENEALEAVRLENLSSGDSLQIRSIVQNHLARSNYSTAEVEYQSKRIFVYNTKKILFNHEGSNYFFGEKELRLKNIICSNGVIHSLKQQVPVQPNIWELIHSDPNLSEINRALAVYDTIYFDQAHSQQVGFENGKIIYDSVLIIRNKMLEKLGPIYDEDSLFTCILPSNEAYAKLYEEYRPYFNSNGGLLGNEDPGQVAKQRTDSAILSNLIFRGDYSNPAGRDSIVNTAGQAFYRPGEIFNADWQKMSNGWAMISDQLNMSIHDTYYCPIVREAERAALATVGVDTRSLIGYPHSNSAITGISGSFIRIMEGEGGRPTLCIYFGPKALSAKYDLYCTIVPPIAENPLSDEKGTIIDFGFVYNRNAPFRPGKIDTPNERLLTGYKTDPTRLETVLVKKDLEIRTFDGEPGLTITLNVPASQLETYGRSARIDNIYLIPSK